MHADVCVVCVYLYMGVHNLESCNLLLVDETLYGTIMKPTTVQAGEKYPRKYPTILNVYSGPHIQVRHEFKFKPHVTSNALSVCSEQVWLSTDEDALND